MHGIEALAVLLWWFGRASSIELSVPSRALLKTLLSVQPAPQYSTCCSTSVHFGPILPVIYWRKGRIVIGPLTPSLSRPPFRFQRICCMLRMSQLQLLTYICSRQKSMDCSPCMIQWAACRYWIQETYEAQHAQHKEPESIDKEFLRLWFRERCDPYADKVRLLPHCMLCNR
jgi:hypothetical protein